MGGDLDGPLMVEEVPSEMPTVEAVEDEPVKDEPSGDEQNRDVGTTGADASQMQTQVKRESVNPTIEFPSEPAYPLALQPELPHSQNTSPESAASHHLHPQPQAAAPSPFDTSSEEPLSGWGGSEAEYGLERPRELERSVGRREQGNIASNRKGSEKQVVADSARETSVSVMSDASEARVAMKTTAAGITGPPETDASSAQIPDVNVPGSREHQMAEDQMVEQDLGLTAEADVQALATDGTPEHQVAEAMTDIPVNAELGADLGAMGRGIEGSMLLEEEQPDAGAEEMEESDDDEDWFGVSSKFKTREPSAPPAGPSQIAQVRSIQMTAEQGTALYHRIHGNERRRATMSDDDRRKYPVFFEQHNESEQLAQMHKESREKEIAALTAQLADTEVPVPAYLRRRGILLGFRGDFALALADLDKAFEYDPFNSEACWYRHQLLLLNGDVQKALRDLDMITETNRLHMAAFQTRGRIYQELGMIKMAIVNYSQVIKLKPHDADAYFQRATLFEQEDEMVYANEDYRMVRNLDPNNEPALRNLAMYSFQRQLWGDSLAAFTRLIQLNVKNSEAYLFRGRAYAHRGDWEEALQDITTAIHISPQDAQAYFHRASLFRRRNPFKAIEDFSLSILLDTTDTFYEAYYQRGLLYYSLEQYEYAVADLITVTELEPLHHQAYLSLGILYMRFLNNLPAALRCLQKCVSINPIQTYGYLCCGDLYQMMLKTPPAETPPAVVLRPSSNPSSRAVSRGGKPSDLDILLRTNEHYMKAAVRQYDKAIHLSPSSANLYLYRGRVLLRLGLMREATNDFQIAFALNAEIAQTFVQRALILSFQRKYQQIIDEFNRESRLKTVEDPQLYMLVAKARISCGDHEGALKNLAEALRHNKRESEVYLLRGICYEKLRDWANAIKEFTPCIQLNPQFSKAYYHRGISKLHLRDEDGTYDLDKAIKLDPDFFEAYIARASYYQSKGEYNLAIDDCDEASRIEPTSIRACLLKGACNCKLGEFDMAIQDFTKAMVIDRTSHYALYNRAVTYQLMKEYESAIKDYSTAMLLCSDSNAYRNRGLLYWQQGDPENALIDLYAARDAFPEDAKLRALLGLCLQKLGKVEQAIEEFSSAIKLNVFMREAYIARANVHAMAGQTEQARKDYLRVLHMDPRCIEALINIAYTFQRDGRQKKAYDLFTAALAIDPNCKPALEGRAVIQYGRANFFGALIDVSKAIALDPRNAEYLTNAGVICQALGDDVSAMQSYKLALKSDPEYAHAHLNMANMCFSQSKYEEALRQYTEVLKTVPNCVAAYLNRGITKAILKDLTGALDDFNRAAIPENTTAEVFFNRAHVLQLLGRQEEAEKDYTHILQLSPADSLVYLRRGDVRGHRADMYGAMEDYAMAISQSAD
ncbi:uncharacterized protein EV422DRAFT_585274 [Fimicolochytrium jonesii]|uniref:uncharacterized protein n=1 Tax=Fimicolochytrium jonesii TaxID=1396493 RepID=UPI0022FE0C77|nr:uncharacterized protein EV422DRAFT_585274 [Fimicolochytrium jonesii]KAI8823702.1 hypothetical protein EV422DRAFT_585274 [Fimicolochytrium jonesii]